MDVDVWQMGDTRITKKVFFRISLIVQARKGGLHALIYVRMVVGMIMVLSWMCSSPSKRRLPHTHDTTARLIKTTLKREEML